MENLKISLKKVGKVASDNPLTTALIAGGLYSAQKAAKYASLTLCRRDDVLEEFSDQNLGFFTEMGLIDWFHRRDFYVTKFPTTHQDLFPLASKILYKLLKYHSAKKINEKLGQKIIKECKRLLSKGQNLGIYREDQEFDYWHLVADSRHPIKTLFGRKYGYDFTMRPSTHLLQWLNSDLIKVGLFGLYSDKEIEFAFYPKKNLLGKLGDAIIPDITTTGTTLGFAGGLIKHRKYVVKIYDAFTDAIAGLYIITKPRLINSKLVANIPNNNSLKKGIDELNPWALYKCARSKSQNENNKWRDKGSNAAFLTLQINMKNDSKEFVDDPAFKRYIRNSKLEYNKDKHCFNVIIMAISGEAKLPRANSKSHKIQTFKVPRYSDKGMELKETVHDAEAKILLYIQSQIHDHLTEAYHQISGMVANFSIELYPEREPCQSCGEMIKTYKESVSPILRNSSIKAHYMIPRCKSRVPQIIDAHKETSEKIITIMMNMEYSKLKKRKWKKQ